MYGKQVNAPVTLSLLKARALRAQEAGFPKAKWIEFCEILLAEGYVMLLYEARKTVSKYVTVMRPNAPHTFKVRFSNHKPIPSREARGDCDFFVGVTNLGWTNTAQALEATRAYFKNKRGGK